MWFKIGQMSKHNCHKLHLLSIGTVFRGMLFDVCPCPLINVAGLQTYNTHITASRNIIQCSSKNK